MTPRDVSVVVVNWNGLSYLEGCLGSLPGEVEAVLVDNGSSDGSVPFVRNRFPAARVVENVRNLGFSAANNIGLSAARGAYVLFLNNDTVALEGAVERLRAVFDRDPRVAIAGARLENADGVPQPFSIGRTPSFAGEVRRVFSALMPERRHDDFDYARSGEVATVCGAALMARRSVLNEVGGWPEEYFAYAEDADLCRRVAARGHTVWYESGARVLHYYGGAGKNRGVAAALRAQIIAHVSLNRYIRRYEGRGKALLHAALFPVDVLLRAARRLARGT